MSGTWRARSGLVRSAALLAALAMGGAGCASISPEMRQALAAPPDCEVAGAQQQILLDARSNGWDRFVAGFQGIVPPWSLFSGLHDLAGDPEDMYTDHWRVATGRWDDEVEAKVVQIRATCHPDMVR